MRDKQIEEMVQHLCNTPNCIFRQCEGKCRKNCIAYKYAVRAISVGYRKKSDVAREIFEEIEDIRLEHSYGEIDGYELNVKLFNLKKKYESEGEG